MIGIVIILIILGALFHASRPSTKGESGERKIASLLSMLPESDYEILNHVLLESGNRTSEIDHIVISKFGIFVIETKNYKGWIFGNEHAERWTQVIYQHRETFFNPIKQNYTHIRTLRRIFPDINQRAFISIVAFSARCRLKEITTETPVVYFRQVVGVIEQYQEKVLSSEQVIAVRETLLRANIYSKEAIKKHVQHVREQTRKNIANIKSGLCPRCGSDLMLRHGRYGEFIGCSNYPKCTFKRNL